MADENIQINAKLKLDTDEAEAKLGQVGKDAAKSLKETFADKDKGLGSITKLAKGAAGGLGGIATALTDIASVGGKASGAVGLVITLVTVVVKFVKKLFEGTDTLQEINRMWNSLVYTMRQVLAPVIALIGEIVMDTIDILRVSIMPVIEVLSDLLQEGFTRLAFLVKLVKPLLEIAGKLANISAQISQVFSDTLLGVMSSLFNIVIELVNVGLKPIMDLLDKVTNFILRIKKVIQDFITTITGGLITFDNALARTSGQQGGYKTSLDVWETSGQDVTTGDELIVDAIEENTKSTKGGLSNFIQEFKNSDVGKIFTEIVRIASNVLEPLSKVIGAYFNVAASAINVIARVIDGIGGVISSFLGVIESIFRGLSGVIDNIRSGINNYIINPINSVLNKIKNIEILGKKPFDFISTLRTFAGGGSLDGVQVWGMNEKGNPEFMFNAGGHDTVINAEILSNAMYDAIKRAGGTSSGRIEVSVKENAPAGPRELAQWLLPSLKFALKS